MAFTIQTNYPVALNSMDHLYPLGTMRDNTRNPAFNEKLYQLIAPNKLRVLDLGCAGGGFVKSLLDDGAIAVGIEGSDYSRVRGRAEWIEIPWNLFTADITKLFQVFLDGEPALFPVITAWEFLEHISESDLPAVFGNINRHLSAGGMFIGSINTLSSHNEQIEMHQIIESEDWWNSRLKVFGYERQPELERHFGKDWLRVDTGAFQVVLKACHG